MEVAEASLTGFFKTVLIIIGAFVLLRFLGQLAIAKRNMDAEKEAAQREKDLLRERNRKMKDFGKVSIQKSELTPKSLHTAGDISSAAFFMAAALIRTLLPQADPAWTGLASLGKRLMTATLFLVGAGLTVEDLRKAGGRPLLCAILLWIIMTTVSLTLIKGNFIALAV